MPEDSLRRTLALLCGRLCFGSGHELCAGAAQAARENNVDLTVFPGPLSHQRSDVYTDRHRFKILSKSLSILSKVNISSTRRRAACPSRSRQV